MKEPVPKKKEIELPVTFAQAIDIMLDAPPPKPQKSKGKKRPKK